MKTIDLTCVECPLGCDISVVIDGDKVLSVKGNSCPRGEKYATSEVICPKRVLTTTLKTDKGKTLPVKSKEPIDKSKVFLAMAELNKITVQTPVKVGDIVATFDEIDIVACMDCK